MTDSPIVLFGDLPGADLAIDVEYEGGSTGNILDDPLQYLLPVGNAGGFRYHGSPHLGSIRLPCLLTGDHPDWPDSLDKTTGRFEYYGDNRTPGRLLHDTQRGGNELLREVFEAIHAREPQRDLVPPFLVFTKSGRGRGLPPVNRST
jgi:hypothetical protein